MYIDPWGLVSKAEFGESIDQTRDAYKKVQVALQQLGVMAQNGNSSDDQLYAQVDEIQRLYDQYRSQNNSMMGTANDFYGGQWWVSGKDKQLMDAAFQLSGEDPANGAISPNPETLNEAMIICCNLCNSAEKVANRTQAVYTTARVAETTCTIASAAGGVTLIGKEAAKLGLKKGAAYVAKQAAMIAAGQIATTIIISKAEEMGFTETQIRMGVAAFQILAMHKAFQGKQGCFETKTGPYSHLKDHKSVGPGKNFTATQKQNIRMANMQRNKGVLLDDDTGDILALPQQHKNKITPPINEAQVDHMFPKSKGGTNSYSNAKLISRKRNIEKGNQIQ